MQPRAEGHDAEYQPDHSRARGPGARSAWVVVIEATAGSDQPHHSFEAVRRLALRLGEWRTTALYCADRYAVQLDVQASSWAEALQVAIGEHRRAADELAMAPVFLRAEVLTPDVLEDDWDAEIAKFSPVVGQGLVPAGVYQATRAVLRATTVAEIRSALAQFVAGAGGTVNSGPRGARGATVTADLGLVPDDDTFASADELSVAGMLIELSLPALVDDARHACRRLGRRP